MTSSAPKLGAGGWLSGALDMPERMIGRRAGRYVLRDVVASGGSGFVYLATDVDLQRTVALKLIVPPVAVDMEAAREFMLVEAQAVARIDHANVVRVYDVGEIDGMVFLAMEFVVGSNLRVWQRERHGWREVLDVYRQAGHGLAAAHAAGVVHRDFKPANVMLGDDGRVRVLDFGLATPAPRSEPATVDLDATATDSSPEGTPTYMAPEQHLGQLVGPRSDQFSYCVSLYEALYGRLPFAGGHTPHYRDHVLRGEVDVAVNRRRVPGWLRAVLLRGLSTDPADRYPEMGDLLAAMARRRRARRRRLAGVAVCAWIGVTASLSWHARRDEAAFCGDAMGRIDRVHGGQANGLLIERFKTTGLPYAEPAARAAARQMDASVAAWRRAMQRACPKAWHDDDSGTPSDDPHLRCLEHRRTEFEALHARFVAASPATVRHASELIAAVPDPAVCETAEAGRVWEQITSDDIDHVDRVLRQRWDAIERFDSSGAGLDLAAGEPSVWAAELWLVRAEFAERVRRYPAALAAYHDAIVLTERTGDRRLGARAWLGLLRVHIELELEPRAATEAAAHVDALLEGADAVELAVELLALRGRLALQMGDPDTAYELATRGLARVGSVRFPMPLERALRLSLARAHAARGQRDLAVEIVTQTIERTRVRVGTQHPDAIVEHHVLADLLDDEAEARAEHELAYELALSSFVAPHHELAVSHLIFATWLVEHGEPDEAFGHAKQAHEQFMVLHGADHLDATKAMVLVADMEQARGEVELAAQRLDRAAAFVEEAFGPDTLLGARLGLRRAMLLRAAGDVAQADRLHRESSAALERHLPAEHAEVQAVRADQRAP